MCCCRRTEEGHGTSDKEFILKSVPVWFDKACVLSSFDELSVSASALGPSGVFAEVFGGVLAAFLTSPWTVGLAVSLALTAAVRAVRAVVYGGRHPDPVRRFSRAQRAEIMTRAGNRCEQHSWLDGRCRETEGLQADHIHPHARGGTTNVANGQALCRRHNKQKSDRVPWNWELSRVARRREAYFPPGIRTAVARYGAPAGQPVEV